MKTKLFKSAFANTVLSIESLNYFWSLFSDLYKYDDPKKAIMFANCNTFKNNIFEFEPLLTPYSDYDVEVREFKITEKYFTVSIDNIIDDVCKNSVNYDNCTSFVNGVKQKLVNPKEYFRLVIVHIMTNPVVDDKQPFMIFKLISAPKLFTKPKKCNFRIPVSNEIDNEFPSYKYHRSFAFFINFFTENEENEKGESIIFENIISCSEVHTLNTMLIDDSGINYPPHFSD
jgi:hypothetical protein